MFFRVEGKLYDMCRMLLEKTIIHKMLGNNNTFAWDDQMSRFTPDSPGFEPCVPVDFNSPIIFGGVMQFLLLMVA